VVLVGAGRADLFEVVVREALDLPLRFGIGFDAFVVGLCETGELCAAGCFPFLRAALYAAKPGDNFRFGCFACLISGDDFFPGFDLSFIGHVSQTGDTPGGKVCQLRTVASPAHRDTAAPDWHGRLGGVREDAP
jgi:hypothetical protein